MRLIDQDIVDLNLFWLIKARELAKVNREKAVVVLGLDASLANNFTSLSIDELNTIAHTGVLLFRPRFRPALWRQIIAHASHPSLPDRLQMLLMAAREQSDR